LVIIETNKLPGALKLVPTALAAGLLAALVTAPAFTQSEGSLITPAVRHAMDAARPESIRAHVRYLSDDLLEGRDTASTGGLLAARYIASELEQMGVKPAGDNGGYFQQIPFVRARMDAVHSQVALEGGDAPVILSFGKDFLLNGTVRTSAHTPAAPLVFVGYGITAPEFNYDDYKDLNVKGKVVVALSGEPVSHDPAFFDGDKDTKYAGGGSKLSRAFSNGAVGMITLITGPRAASYPWEPFRTAAATPALGLDADFRDGFPALLAKDETAEKLFAGSGTTWKEVTEAIPVGQVKPLPLKLTAKIELAMEKTPAPGPNVLGILEGSDPDLKKQVVVLSAHYDHIGKRQGEGDTVNNGAWDNASGTSGVLESARQFAALEPRPRRSILFLFVTGEEKGLLGSRYYTQHPAVPMEQTAADINMDMTDVFGIPKEIVPQGAERSGLLRSAEAVAQAMNMKIGVDPTPELGAYTRSDQFSFAQAGVPALFLRWANEYEDIDATTAKERSQRLFRTTYHTVRDEFDPNWSWEGMRRHAQMAFLLALHVADQDQMPAWNEGDPFNKPRHAVPERAN
jgi:hypothetical protein